MEEVECSFCREIGDSSEVLSLRELEFDDWHGWPKSVTEVVGEIHPEVTVSLKNPAKSFSFDKNRLFLSESNRNMQRLSADRSYVLQMET